MKGSVRIILLVSLGLFLCTTALPAQTLQMTLNKTVGPGRSYVVDYDGITFRISTDGHYKLTFQRIDTRYIGLHIKPIPGEPMPYCDLVIQWGSFPANILTIDTEGGGYYILDSETGYAEK